LRIFGTKRVGITGEWRKLNKEEHNDLYCSSNIVRVIKSRRMFWAAHVACIGERRVERQDFVRYTGGKEATGKTQA